METSDSQSWRAILKHITRPMGERQRLVKTLDIVPMTLNRWLNGESLPHKGHILRLLHVVNPSLREELMDALEVDFPEIRLLFESEGVEQLSSALFAELLNLRATTPRSLLFHRMSNAVLDKAILLLDPHRLGMAITIARCMPPTPEHYDKVYSLKEWAGRGTPPWKPNLEADFIFLGAESLGGYATQKGYFSNVPDLKAETRRQTRRTEHEVSAAAFPIMLSGSIAGCITASSTQLDYFSKEYIELLEVFSYLASLAFENQEFYLFRSISLQMMPSQEAQMPIIGKVWERVMDIQEETLRRGETISNAEAERQAWSAIEADLLAIGTKRAQS
jgi:hypothetical protein